MCVIDQQETPPTAFILYGATGDLARRLVLPALYRLAQVGLLPSDWRLIGNGRGNVSHDEFRARVKSALEEFGKDKPDGATWTDFEKRCFFAGGGFDKDNAGTLLEVLKEVTADMNQPQLVHYFAVPPTNFAKLTDGVHAHGLVEGSKVVYEKPYGTSPSNFEELDKQVQGILDEQQVFRIDHFLGKEGAQNLHIMRFANGLFDGVWNRDHVEAVQIDIPETLDISDRAGFYDATGAFLDMIVTHLFQLAAEVAMEPPVSMSAGDVQEARESVMAAFRPLDPKADVVLGQFDGYQDVDGIGEDSATDTFAAVRLWVDTDRWHGVPFLLRSGKQLAVSDQRVSLIFKKPRAPMHHLADSANVLTFVLRGEGAIELTTLVKRPGIETVTSPVKMNAPLSDIPNGLALTAYARLIHDVLVGDRTLFTQPEGLAHAWKAVAPLLEDRPAVIGYEPGSWGPDEAMELAAPHGWLLGND